MSLPHDPFELIEQIYSASTEPDLWPDVCRLISEHTRASTALLPYNLARLQLIAPPISYGYDGTYVESYGAYYGARNPLTSTDWHQPEGSVAAMEDIVARSQLENTEYYQDWMHPQRFSHIVGSTFQVGSSTQLFIALARDKAYRSSETRLLEQLMPHLRRSFQIGAQFDGLFSQRTSLRHALDQFGVAAISLSRDGTVLDVNPEAERLLALNTTFQIRLGKIYVTGSGSPAPFQKALKNVIDGGIAQELTYASPEGSVRVTLQPIATSHAWLGDTLPRALLLIQTPRKGHDRLSELTRMSGLTPAEVRLFGFLVHGGTLADYSDQHHVSRNTAKSQLQSIFRKTGVSRQAELVRLAVNGIV